MVNPLGPLGVFNAWASNLIASPPFAVLRPPAAAPPAPAASAAAPAPTVTLTPAAPRPAAPPPKPTNYAQAAGGSIRISPSPFRSLLQGTKSVLVLPLTANIVFHAMPGARPQSGAPAGGRGAGGRGSSAAVAAALAGGPPPSAAGGGRGGGRGAVPTAVHRPEPPKPISVPTEDFDFDAMFRKFKKEEIKPVSIGGGCCHVHGRER